MICILNNLTQDKLYLNAFCSSNVKTDPLIISSHRSKPEMDYSSLRRAQKPYKENKCLRTKTNFKQSLGKFSSIAQAGNSGKETTAAGSHLAFASYPNYWKHRGSGRHRHWGCSGQSTASECRTTWFLGCKSPSSAAVELGR